MGGCASKPKGYDFSEAPSSSNNPQPEIAAHEIADGGENQNEKPQQVDLSEPEKEKAQDYSSSESKAAAVAAEPTSAETAIPTAVDDVKADANITTEEKVEASDRDEIAVPAKEISEADKSNAAPSKEEAKTDDAPLITL